MPENNCLKFSILSCLKFYPLEMHIECQILIWEIKIPLAALKCGYHFFHILGKINWLHCFPLINIQTVLSISQKNH